jgi:hypothetical protein
MFETFVLDDDGSFDPGPSPGEGEALAPDFWAEAAEAASRELRDWVETFVADYELWAEIPPCWAEHPAMRLELATLYAEFLAVRLARSGGIPAWAAAAASFAENRRRALEGLAHSPAARCAAKGEHRPARTWDREASLEQRRRARRAAKAEPDELGVFG